MKCCTIVYQLVEDCAFIRVTSYPLIVSASFKSIAVCSAIVSLLAPAEILGD